MLQVTCPAQSPPPPMECTVYIASWPADEPTAVRLQKKPRCADEPIRHRPQHMVEGRRYPTCYCSACGASHVLASWGCSLTQNSQASDKPARGCNRQVHARMSAIRSEVGVALQREQHLDIRAGSELNLDTVFSVFNRYFFGSVKLCAHHCGLRTSCCCFHHFSLCASGSAWCLPC